MPRLYTLLFAFVLAIFFPAIAHSVDPKTVGAGEYDATLSWVLDFGATALPSEATLRVYPPSNTVYQQASYSSPRPYSEEKDEFGNAVLVFSFAPQSRYNEITLDAQITTSYDPLKTEYAKATEMQAFYLPESSLVTISGEISSIAQSVVQGKASNDFERLAMLSEWVHNNIEYDLNWKDFAAGSVETLSAKRGTCDEMGHLLIAMLRSQKIPARLAVGYVYSGEKWGPHAWIEAMVDGKWIPADPTYGEVGELDATHVQIATGRDQDDTRFEISARGFNLDLSQTTVKPDADFNVKKQENFSDFFSLEAQFPQGFRDAESKEAISATVRSKATKPIAVPLYLGLYKDFTITGYADKVAVVYPGAEAKVSWGIIYPSTMEPNYYYNYSASITALSTRVDATLEGQLGAQKTVEEQVSITNFRARKFDSSMAIFATLQNTGNVDFETVQIELNSSQKTEAQAIPLAIGESKTLEFAVPVEEGAESISGTLEITAGKTRAMQTFQIAIEKPKPLPTATPQTALEEVQKQLEGQIQKSAGNAPDGFSNAAQNLSSAVSDKISQTKPEDLLIYASVATILILLLLIMKALIRA